MPNNKCKMCGCAAGRHTKDGCAGVQHLTPWDREPCRCGLTLAQVRSQS